MQSEVHFFVFHEWTDGKGVSRVSVVAAVFFFEVKGDIPRQSPLTIITTAAVSEIKKKLRSNTINETSQLGRKGNKKGEKVKEGTRPRSCYLSSGTDLRDSV